MNSGIIKLYGIIDGDKILTKTDHWYEHTVYKQLIGEQTNGYQFRWIWKAIKYNITSLSVTHREMESMLTVHGDTSTTFRTQCMCVC